jgi:hypothetical protein
MDVEVYVGATVGGAWPNRKTLDLLYKYSSNTLDYFYAPYNQPNQIADFQTDAYWKIRMCPGAWVGQGYETFINVTRLKVEMELLP